MSRENHKIQNKGPVAEILEGRHCQRLGHMACDILSFCLGHFIWNISKGDVDQP